MNSNATKKETASGMPLHRTMDPENAENSNIVSLVYLLQHHTFISFYHKFTTLTLKNLTHIQKHHPNVKQFRQLDRFFKVYIQKYK